MSSPTKPRPLHGCTCAFTCGCRGCHRPARGPVLVSTWGPGTGHSRMVVFQRQVYHLISQMRKWSRRKADSFLSVTQLGFVPRVLGPLKLLFPSEYTDSLKGSLGSPPSPTAVEHFLSALLYPYGDSAERASACPRKVVLYLRSHRAQGALGFQSIRDQAFLSGVSC